MNVEAIGSAKQPNLLGQIRNGPNHLLMGQVQSFQHIRHYHHNNPSEPNLASLDDLFDSEWRGYEGQD